LLPLKVKNLLGLAQRAGKIISGEAMVKEALVRNKKVYFVVMAVDASSRVKEEFKFLTEKKKIALEELGSKDELGAAIGKGARVLLAITDSNFAHSFQERFSDRAN